MGYKVGNEEVVLIVDALTESADKPAHSHSLEANTRQIAMDARFI